MLNSNFKRINFEYEVELLKQTNKYEYFLKYESNNVADLLENNDDGIKGVQNEDPFICIEENETYRVYDAGCYLLYEEKKGVSSDKERKILIQNAIKLNADLMYSDSDYIKNNGCRHTPFLKPCWSPETYRSFDYIKEYYCVKKELNNVSFEKIKKILHLPEILYHVNSEQTENEIYKGIAEAYVSPDYFNEYDASNEKISVVIPSKDNPNLLEQCLTSLKRAKINSGINSLEVVIVDNGSTENNVASIKDVINSNNSETFVIKYIFEPSDFNFSAMCNRGVSETNGDYLLFLNDDIEVIDDMFLVKLLFYARKEHVGAVAPKLYYPESNGKCDRIIQHTGITNLMKCGPSHKLSTHSDNEVYYFGFNKINRNVLAVTGACLMVNRAKYFLINGFYDKMKVGYNDVDLCISLYERGYFNVVVNDTVLYHHESVSRGSDTVSKEKYQRLKKERDLLYERHPFLMSNDRNECALDMYQDPFYNVNLCDDSLDYNVNVTPLCDDRCYRSRPDYKLSSYIKRHKKSIYGKDFEVKNSKHAHMNIENVHFERGIFDEGDALVISGWSLLDNRDNAYFDRYLIIQNDENISVYSVAPKYRDDVKNVFTDAKNALLSGFVAKIQMDSEESIKYKDAKFGILLVSKITGRKYYAGK